MEPHEDFVVSWTTAEGKKVWCSNYSGVPTEWSESRSDAALFDNPQTALEALEPQYSTAVVEPANEKSRSQVRIAA